MEYAASLIKIKPNMKLYIRGEQLCMELTNQIKPSTLISDEYLEELSKIMTNIHGKPTMNICIEHSKVVVYIKDFHSHMINNIR
jgi:hypothetical protein